MGEIGINGGRWSSNSMQILIQIRDISQTEIPVNEMLEEHDVYMMETDRYENRRRIWQSKEDFE